MSKEIDWSNAPADATHRGAINWFKSDGEKVYTFDGAVWHPVSWEIWQLAPFAKRPSIHADEWSGEGLPPVGVACKIIGGDSKWWSYSGFESGEIVTVRHSFKNSKGYDMVVVEGCDGGCLAVTVDCVAVIRTPEQIAAGLREAAVTDMHAIYMKGAVHGGGLYAIYDAGFRKP